MKNLIGQTIKEIKITDNKTVIYFESGMNSKCFQIKIISWQGWSYIKSRGKDMIIIFDPAWLVGASF